VASARRLPSLLPMRMQLAPARKPARRSAACLSQPHAPAGCPASALPRLVHDSWRMTNYNDLVPTVPRLLGYSHVRHGVRLTAEGRLVFETEGLADLFGEGRSHGEVLAELLGQVGRQQGCWGDAALRRPPLSRPIGGRREGGWELSGPLPQEGACWPERADSRLCYAMQGV
jgi:hypothetical protein